MNKTRLTSLARQLSLAAFLGIVAFLVTTLLVEEMSKGVTQETDATLENSENLFSLETLGVTSTQESTETTSIDEGNSDPEITVESTIISSTPAITDSGQRELVTLAGGCFWCTEAYLQETAGVVSAISGYAGGSADTADYKTVSRGSTEHREAVQVVYDPARVSLTDILEAYWTHIDPVDEGGQFADRGFHYTTAIYYHNETQRQVAEASKQALSESGLFNESIATEILPFSTFFEAEEYHQDYYLKASAHYERYKKASGRAGFIEDNWAKEAALEFFESQETEQAAAAPAIPDDYYIERDWTEAEIATAQQQLSAEVYRIVAEDGTERSFQNKYYDHKEAGLYVDVVTGQPLYSSTHKYDSGTGWPAFYRPIDEDYMIYETDYKLIMPRTEVRSAGGHLGHVFTDGPDEHGGKRHCINSLALDFVPLAELETRGYGDYLYLF